MDDKQEITRWIKDASGKWHDYAHYQLIQTVDRSKVACKDASCGIYCSLLDCEISARSCKMCSKYTPKIG